MRNRWRQEEQLRFAEADRGGELVSGGLEPAREVLGAGVGVAPCGQADDQRAIVTDQASHLDRFVGQLKAAPTGTMQRQGD